MTDVEMSLRGLLVAGPDTEGVAATAVGTPVTLLRKGGPFGNDGPV